MLSILISLTTLFVVIISIVRTKNEAQENKRAIQRYSAEIVLLIKNTQETLSAQGKAISKIIEDISLIQENGRDMNAHDKMTDVMLTKIKSDLAKIITAKK